MQCVYLQIRSFLHTYAYFLLMDRWLKTGNLKNTCDDSDLPLTNDKQFEYVKDNGLIENSDNSLLANSDLIVPTSSPKCHSNKRGVKRKYDESYLGFEFTWTGSEDYPGALCVICQKLLHNGSLVSAKMKRHLKSYHPNLVGKDILFFKARLREVKDMQKVIHSTTFSTKKLLEVSYLISKRIAIAGEAHAIAEDLIKPCILEAAKILLNKSDHQKLESIPLSNSSVSRRIDNMEMYEKSEVCSRLQQVDFFCFNWMSRRTWQGWLCCLHLFVMSMMETFKKIWLYLTHFCDRRRDIQDFGYIYEQK